MSVVMLPLPAMAEMPLIMLAGVAASPGFEASRKVASIASDIARIKSCFIQPSERGSLFGRRLLDLDGGGDIDLAFDYVEFGIDGFAISVGH
jgi:hypothetical protein